jgi:Flp pilus assembly pilin Flp
VILESEMITAIVTFWRREDGQDLADYCLLTALVALVAAGIMFRVSGGLDSLWGIGNQNLDAAKSTVQSNGMSGNPK